MRKWFRAPIDYRKGFGTPLVLEENRSKCFREKHRFLSLLLMCLELIVFFLSLLDIWISFQRYYLLLFLSIFIWFGTVNILPFRLGWIRVLNNFISELHFLTDCSCNFLHWRRLKIKNKKKRGHSILCSLSAQSYRHWITCAASAGHN